jgi:hypothetical protein
LTNKVGTENDQYFLSSIWMSGYGLAANAGGSVYFVTGNTSASYTTNSYDPVNNISESAVKFSADLSTQQAIYTPGDQFTLDLSDGDFSAGGLMLLPVLPNQSPALAVAAGKDGIMHIMNADTLDDIGMVGIGKCWCGPSYFEESDGKGRVVGSGDLSVTVFRNDSLTKPDFEVQSVYSGVKESQDPGFFTSVSSNGRTPGSAVVWAVSRPTSEYPAYVNLYAVNPDTGSLLFTSVAGEWHNIQGNANIVPVVANGYVYVASDGMLAIFGPGGTAVTALPQVGKPPIDDDDLEAGEHEIYGTVRQLGATDLSIMTRGGTTIAVSTDTAQHTNHYELPYVGQGLVVRGSFSATGGRPTLVANTVRRAKGGVSMWPADR